MLEILLVVVLVALSYTLLPRLLGGGVSGTELKANARAVAAGLRMARETAINTRRESTLIVDVNQHSFVITNDERTYRLHEKLEVKLFTAQADAINESTSSFRFYPDGSSNGGRVTIGANGREFAIDIDWLTGRISVIDSVDAELRSQT